MEDGFSEEMAQRRSFLQALGVVGGLSAEPSLAGIRDTMAGETKPLSDISPIRNAVGDGLDPSRISAAQSSIAEATKALPAMAATTGPDGSVPAQFSPIGSAGRRLSSHLEQAGFYEATMAELPAFTQSYLTSALDRLVRTEQAERTLASLGLDDAESVQLLSTVFDQLPALENRHWIGTDSLDRNSLATGEFIPPMTQAAVDGAILWLEDLDVHLYQKEVLLTETHREDAIWYGRSLAAGLSLLAAGARMLPEAGADEAAVEALMSVGFAVTSIQQKLLPTAVYYIAEDERGPRRTGLEVPK